MRPQAVTFDFHNTLARCDAWFQMEIRDLVPAFLRWHAAGNQVTVPESILNRSVELYRELRLDIMNHGEELDAATCIDVVTRELGLEFDPDVIQQGLHDTMRETLADSQPIDGAVNAITALQSEGIKLGIISSAVYHPFLEWSLAKFAIDDAFDTIVTSASCGFYKSRTEIYTLTLETLGVTAENAVHVGDSHRFDVVTADKLGMRTILLDEADATRQTSPATAVVRTLVGVDRIILNGLGERGI